MCPSHSLFHPSHEYRRSRDGIMASMLPLYHEPQNRARNPVASLRPGYRRPALQVAHEHLVRMTLRYRRYYPDHPPRSASALYRRTHHELIESQNQPCKVCGTREDREVHHFHCEWADALGVDWHKMRVLHPDFDWMHFSSASDFVDSTYNMMVLCVTHHRLRNHGIHMLPYPVWIMQAIKLSSFVFAPAPALRKIL